MVQGHPTLAGRSWVEGHALEPELMLTALFCGQFAFCKPALMHFLRKTGTSACHSNCDSTVVYMKCKVMTYMEYSSLEIFNVQ